MRSAMLLLLVLQAMSCVAHRIGSDDLQLFRASIYNADINVINSIIGKHRQIVNMCIDEYCNDLPLHLSVYRNCYDCSHALIVNGADVNETKITGDAPLHISTAMCNLELTQLLIQHGADINKQDKGSGFTPLHHALDSSCSQVVEFLLSHGAKPNINSSNNVYPLHLAVRNGDIELTKSLVDRGADVNCVDNNMNTPLHVAAFMNMRRTPSESATYWFPLSSEELERYDQIITILVGAGANIDAENRAGFTPLHIAIAQGHKSKETMLKSLGAIDTPQNNIVWRTVLETFSRHGGIEAEDVSKGFVETKWDDSADTRVKSIIRISNMKVGEGSVTVKRIWKKKESGKWSAQYEDLEDSRRWSDRLSFWAQGNLKRSMDYYTGAM